MARMSNRDRIAQAAAEASAAAAEKAAEKAAKKTAKKAAKKTTKKATKRASRSKAKEVRMRVVWAVCNQAGRPVETFDYPDKEQAIVRAQQLTSSTGYAHEVRDVKVPME